MIEPENIVLAVMLLLIITWLVTGGE